ncbi:MAG TPA: SgcJ/EcaC family oxidoreductase [Longimicrobiales bacterium]|nr:SgcJ/EcaC family oxidoreductase [Longimicrobiales bacterium]
MTRGATSLFLAAILAVPAAALAQEKQEMAGDHAAGIEAANEAWANAFNAGDAAALTAIYTPDAVVMAPGAERAVGTAAIQALFEAALGAASGVTVTLESAALEHAGDMVLEHGKYVMTGPDGGHADHGSYMAVWRQVDGEWKISRDIWNSSMAPAAEDM